MDRGKREGKDPLVRRKLPAVRAETVSTSPVTAVTAAPAVLQRLGSRRAVTQPADILSLQRTCGNQAVCNLIQAQSEPIAQRQAEDDVPFEEIQLKPAISTGRPGHVQRAWVGLRQLGDGFVDGLIGRPDIWRRRGNFFNLGLYHSHIWLEDQTANPSQPFYDRGHGPHGLFSEPARQGEYTSRNTGLDDTLIRQAIAANDPPGGYKLTGNNCQMWVERVLNSYRGLGGTS
jgi:hypothetical protein